MPCVAKPTVGDYAFRSIKLDPRFNSQSSMETNHSKRKKKLSDTIRKANVDLLTASETELDYYKMLSLIKKKYEL